MKSKIHIAKIYFNSTQNKHHHYNTQRYRVTHFIDAAFKYIKEQNAIITFLIFKNYTDISRICARRLYNCTTSSIRRRQKLDI